MFEYVFGIPLDTVVELFRDGKFVEVFHEFSKWDFIVLKNLFPSDFRRITNLDFVGSGYVSNDRLDSGDDGIECQE